MNYKYIYNEQGQKEAVIIPINEWEDLYKYKNKAAKKPEKKTRLTDMIGAAKGDFKTVGEVDAYINKLRDEWD